MNSYDIICLSHLRWNFVFQRPQHLLTRFRRGRVFFVEEPVQDGPFASLKLSQAQGNVIVVTPLLPPRLSEAEKNEALAALLEDLVSSQQLQSYLCWYYTPMALAFTHKLRPLLSVYDCMDQLSHFRGADPRLGAEERRLFSKVELVFTGGLSLYENKRGQHPRVFPFPSSVDVAHFSRARQPQLEPVDQASIGRPRVGYFGVLDERIDWELLDQISQLRRDLQFVLVGPTCKVDPADLPVGPNLHYLGPKSYQELPEYLAGWQVAMMPFALNEATRYISPTKTPEYLAGGKAVVSTPIQDVIRPYQELDLVHIADGAQAWSQALDWALGQQPEPHLRRADQFLAQNSWDHTWERMQEQIDLRLASTKDQNGRILHV